ncbi:MAG TPA: ATP-binding protein [Pirellulales bacterium]|jgi:signal transduction histidine kinase/ActR/RegA family two-component response regulator|nr:ATP-binding protein [Pirellulales bacterium]
MGHGHDDPRAVPATCLDDILITEELSRRIPRQPDYRAENEAFQALARQMWNEPEALLKALTHTALRLCRAGTAGVSLLEQTSSGEELFRWVALAGACAAYEGGSSPRDLSPSGICLQRKAPQLYSYPARLLTYLSHIQPPVVEGLVIPFGIEKPILGAIWINSHDEQRKFDSEDVRVMTGLAELAAAALHLSTAAEHNARLCLALQDADRRKDEFLATLAHELRNPIAPVRNAVQVLWLKGPAVPELDWARGVIDRQMQQMTRLIDDLLDISRISRNQLEIRKERVKLETVIQGAVEMSRPLIEQHGHELTIALPSEPLVLEADLTRLAQVFSNLLNNAAKYTEPGGRIRLAATRQGSDAVVTVTDTGAGIAAEMLPRIFQMYTQVDRTLERSEGGLGIGLALVKRLTEMHGGSVEASSDGPGQGSEFVVRLPLHLATSMPHGGGAVAKMPVPTSSFRILVVDDNRDAADALGMMLRLLGNQPRMAYDGLEAVKVAGEFQPDVVLLDIGLPKLNGYEAAERIRAQPWGKRIVLIALTGWSQDDDKRRSREAGFDHHMVKPAEPAALMQLLAGLQTSVT